MRLNSNTPVTGLIFVVTLQLVTGCATQPVADRNLLEFLGGDNVTREAVYRKLGEPHGEYEAGRIAAFRLNETAAGYYVVQPAQRRNSELHASAVGWEGVRYSLLVEFGNDDLVESHHLVAVRAE